MTSWYATRALALALTALLLPVHTGAAPALRFFAFGDMPYSAPERAMLDSLLAEVLAERPAFLVHVGDVKAGNAPCTDRGLSRVAELFKAQPVPVLYTPGDNEWTDCGRAGAGGYDPVERLAVLRSLYFGDAGVLRLEELGATHPDPAYPENYWLIREGIFFATVHVVGSHNNLKPRDADAAREHRDRAAANRRHVEAAVRAAKAAGASAFVLLFHANPGLERDSPPRGYERFHEGLWGLLRGFPGPVLAIHGDTHRYRFDRPLRDPETGEVVRRFARMEVPGSPKVAGVWVRVDPDAEEPFAVELAYPDSRGQLGE